MASGDATWKSDAPANYSIVVAERPEYDAGNSPGAIRLTRPNLKLSLYEMREGSSENKAFTAAEWQASYLRTSTAAGYYDIE